MALLHVQKLRSVGVIDNMSVRLGFRVYVNKMASYLIPGVLRLNIPIVASFMRYAAAI